MYFSFQLCQYTAFIATFLPKISQAFRTERLTEHYCKNYILLKK